jgi:hypothetical protein
MSDNNTVIFGDYIEPEDGNIIGRMSLCFQSGTLNLDELWESSSLSAKFLSTFWGSFFPVHDPFSEKVKKLVEDEVHYICAELLGNAVKFSYEPQFMIEICLYLHHHELRFYVTNSLNPYHIDVFQEFIQRILNENPQELFLEQMEKNVLEESMESGVGYLTLVKDYNVTLAWKFQETEKRTVTVLARLPVVRY